MSGVDTVSPVAEPTFEGSATTVQPTPRCEWHFESSGSSARDEEPFAGARGMGGSTAKPPNLEGPIRLRANVRALFRAAHDETFHDGMESAFSRGVCLLVETEGTAAVEVIGELMTESPRHWEAASEALRWLGWMEDRSTYAARLWLLEKSLQHPSPRVRDAAGIGISSLADPHAIPRVKDAIARETVAELRDDLKKVLSEIEGLDSCPT